MKPKVLIAATSRWLATARLAMALAHAGFTVEAVCPTRHPLGKTGAVRKTHIYRDLRPLASFLSAIALSRPDLIVPADDLSVRHLHQLHQRERQFAVSGLASVIERSLGAAEGFQVVCERTKFIEVAEQEHVRVPTTKVIASSDDLKEWGSRVGFPAVLKSNGSSGGEGVRIASSFEEGERALRFLQRPPLLARAAKRALVDRDRTLLVPSLLRHRSVVNAQVFVTGQEATSAIACWNGRVLACLHFEVVKKKSASEPATVLRLIENIEMSTAVERMARRLNLSGLHGFDFMLEVQTGNAYLIEINPRATQVPHLTLGPGRDLPAALYACLSGEAVHASAKLTDNRTIVLFPQEWLRDPLSPYLQSGYHDVPWEEPELIRACFVDRQRRFARHSQRNLNSILSTFPLRRL